MLCQAQYSDVNFQNSNERHTYCTIAPCALSNTALRKLFDFNTAIARFELLRFFYVV